ncbi:alpha/beta fold hydrolase [Ideonella paludis]|uniref:Alpha/beta hydrolase n=1 Tax=Ideonella paludis TaxID=1233411 RepID=A0ABS5E2X7_9BURK|nr:alpha/beta hydrolase [Ideonella paludis]MBQ0937775.1 alpha/beta hydrolase [Ideonella paludis]
MNQLNQVGQGPLKVLWLHGLFGHAQAWGPMVSCLNTALFSHVFIDWRGYGRRKQVPGRHDLTEMAEDALALADQLGWAQFAVVAHDVGALAALQMLSMAPQRLRRWSAIAPVPPSGLSLSAADSAFYANAATQSDVRRSLLDLATGQRLAGPWLEHMVRQSVESATSSAFGDYFRACTHSTVAAQAGWASPALQVLAGEFDGLLPDALLRRSWLSGHPDAQFEVLRNAGHFPMEETPVVLAATVERFLCA